MCGRYVLTASSDAIVKHFGLKQGFCASPRYNIAPGNQIPVIRAEGERIDFLEWGLIPQWAKTPQMTERGFINARVETIAEKPAFKSAFLRRRCLIPANGYYEWHPVRQHKQPYYISAPDDRLFAFAGLWESWSDENGLVKETCTIITMPAVANLKSIHERMPVLLRPTSYQAWLNKRALQSTLLSLLAGAGDLPLRAHPVTTKVNDPRFEHPECLNSL